MASVSNNKQYSSDEEFDDYEDYDAHLGKCRKHINNVAVAKGTTKTQPSKNKIIPLPKKPKANIHSKDGKHVEAKHVEAKHVEAKPVEAKHVDAKHVEAKHVEAKHVEAKPDKFERRVVDDWEDLL